MHTSHKARREGQFDMCFERRFEIGIEIRSSENKVVFKRKGPATPKDIFIIFICHNKLSFRILTH